MVMRKIGIRETKIHFSRIIDQVMRGKEFIITHHNKPVAMLSPLNKKSLGLKDRVNKLVKQGLLEPEQKKQTKLLPPPIPIAKNIAQQFLREDRNE